MGMIGNAPVAGMVGSGNISDGGIETIDIKDGAVTGAKLAVGAAAANLGYTPAQPNQAMYIGTTQVLINRASAALALSGVTLAASAITSGTISPARLGSGSPSSTTYLRGDGTWATVSGGGGSAATQTSLGTVYGATSGNATALGYYSSAGATYSVALGSESGANAQGSVAVGHQATTQGEDSIAMGRSAAAMGYQSITIGFDSISSGNYSVSVGAYAQSAVNGVSIGYQTQGSSDYQTLVGPNIIANSSNPAVLIGSTITSSATGGQVVALNASGSTMNITSPGFYTKAVTSGEAAKMLYYDPASGKITYADAPAGGSTEGGGGGTPPVSEASVVAETPVINSAPAMFAPLPNTTGSRSYVYVNCWDGSLTGLYTASPINWGTIQFNNNWLFSNNPNELSGASFYYDPSYYANFTGIKIQGVDGGGVNAPNLHVIRSTIIYSYFSSYALPPSSFFASNYGMNGGPVAGYAVFMAPAGSPMDLWFNTWAVYSMFDGMADIVKGSTGPIPALGGSSLNYLVARLKPTLFASPNFGAGPVFTFSNPPYDIQANFIIAGKQ